MAEVTPVQHSMEKELKQEQAVDQIEVAGTTDSSSEEEPLQERMTIKTWLAVGTLALTYMTAFQQGACTAAIVKSIDIALGPSTYYNWMLTANTIASTISLPLAGGLSDIFGRRWFMISGAVISLISGIISLAAQNIPTMIAASAIGGLGSGSQQLALAATAELVANKHRGNVQACLDLMILPWSVFGALTGGAMVVYHGKYGFRINFIVGIVLNTICLVAAYFFYYPPKTGLRIGNRTRKQAMKDLDWTGVFLLNAGLILFLVSIGIGGTTFPWKSAGFIAPFIIGVALIAIFIYWEAKIASFPFIDHDLFKGKSRTFSMFLVVDFVAGMGLYAAAAFWAQLSRGVWEADPIKVGLLCIPGGACGAVGGFLAGVTIGKHKFLKANLCLVYGTVIMTAGNFALSLVSPHAPHGIPYALGIASLAMFGTGWTLIALIVCVQLAVDDKDIGSGTLLLGCVRAVGGSVAITVYSTLLNNIFVEKAQAIGLQLYTAGAPLSSIQPLVFHLVNENIALAAQLPGITEPILDAARETMKEVWAEGFKRIYYCAGAFAAAAVVAAAISKDVSQNMTDHVAIRLENELPVPHDPEHRNEKKA